MAGNRVLVIHNPTAGQRSRQRLEDVVTRLRAEGFEVSLRATARKGDAERFAAEADLASHDVLAVAGGDGTINEALNGLASGSPPLAIIPTGTANVLAWEIGVGTRTTEIAATIAHGRPWEVRAGRVNGRRFLAMAGVGFDARVVDGVSLGLKRRIGKAGYVWQALREAAGGAFPIYDIEIDGRIERAASAVVANGRYYAGRYLVAADARLDDGRLHACLFRRPGRFPALRYGIWMGLGRLGRRADYEVIAAERITVQGAESEPVQGDGDVLARLPATFVVDHATVTLMVPG